ncbi:MAG: hypothetical protein M3T49_06450 [Candidatus Eremiobacteraeota bacterium]|nr:hypothetical protein [Candidatus Eremiobacteraeota bacterium]
MAAFGATSCTTSTSIGNVQYAPTKATLGFAVGTLNDAAGALTLVATGSSIPGQYLNSVATLRNPSGHSAFPDSGSATLTAPGGTSYTTGNLYSYGQAPQSNGVLGLPPTYAANGNGIGYSTGFLLPSSGGSPLFPPPLSGLYMLSLAVPVNGSTIPYSASATLPPNPKVLGPVALTFTSDGAGGGTSFVTFAPGMTEALVAVYADNSSAGAPPCTAIGAQAASLEQTGPSATLSSGTLSVGSAYCALALGADYPLVEAGPPFSNAANPAIVGPNGTADLTASALFAFTE